MPGLYLHIPFCKQACHYCDFHFSTALGLKSQVVAALVRELELRADYLGPAATLDTIYFGGGTPSLLTAAELDVLFVAIHRHFAVAPDAEITLEANPDDLTPAKLRELAAGARQPAQHRPAKLPRAPPAPDEPHPLGHRSRRGRCKLAQDAGFENISVDLIYGVPAPDHALWEQDMARAFALGVPHLSCYALTIEPGTVFGHRLKKGTMQAPPDEFVARQFELLLLEMRAHGYEQYEISNFSRPGRESRHNAAYWRGVPYLGLGPSAHSFDGNSRQHTVARNAPYVAAVLERGEVPATVEHLSPRDRANEYLMTSLRTARGCDLRHLRDALARDVAAHHAPYLEALQAAGWATLQQEVLTLTDQGKLLADQITLELFI